MKIVTHIKKHRRERLQRYGLSEILSSCLGIAGYSYGREFLQQTPRAGVALGMSLGNIGYLVPLIYKNLSLKAKHLPYHLTRRERILSLFAEIGPAGLIDNLITRPLIMRYGPDYLIPYFGDFFSVVICKVVTDALFYTIVVADYEIIKLRKSEYEQVDYEKAHHEKK